MGICTLHTWGGGIRQRPLKRYSSQLLFLDHLVSRAGRYAALTMAGPTKREALIEQGQAEILPGREISLDPCRPLITTLSTGVLFCDGCI